ncbi:hypothetical protein NX722_19600 [Endozoicomonas gorgoniicola]|uniref:Transglutaminase-like domain-containing protein n=1 Tax=Endozoicomonas gorgoniicola TaxID=1234144 RepID=A0ABT3MZH8_9GAMM|nr:hypothetical protein [Endozoicomonas gorgoniicola]MCW7554783.1 hypothetical protein [Endozoicomonas gorgoniicola]
MNEMEHARFLRDYSRLFFKNSFKTSNKTYSMSYGTATLLRKMARINYSEVANDLVGYYRDTYDNFDTLQLLTSSPQLARAGNCEEYCGIALKYGFENRIENIWVADHEIHEFLILAADPGISATLTLNEFCQYENCDYWVCDPWFNIHCRMHLYGLMANFKSCQWESEGKEIYKDVYNSERATLWCQRLFVNDMTIYRMTDNNGQPTDDLYDFFSR